MTSNSSNKYIYFIDQWTVIWKTYLSCISCIWRTFHYVWKIAKWHGKFLKNTGKHVRHTNREDISEENILYYPIKPFDKSSINRHDFASVCIHTVTTIFTRKISLYNEKIGQWNEETIPECRKDDPSNNFHCPDE